MLCHGNAHRNQFFVFRANGTLGHGGPRKLPKTLHRFGLSLAKRGEAGVDVLHQSGVVKRAHDSFKKSGTLNESIGCSQAPA